VKIDKDAMIGGVPVKQLRAGLDRLSFRSWTPEEACQKIGIPASETDSVFQALLAAGIVQPAKEDSRPARFKLGREGSALINAKFIKRIDRGKVDELVCGLLERVKEVNAVDRYVMMVVEIRLLAV
jgi:hypothetical protein